MVIAGLVFWVRVRPRHREVWVLYAVVPTVLLLNFSFVAYRQLGLRYILPCWPYLLLLAGFGLRCWVATSRPSWRRGILPMLGAWYLLSALWCFPDYLSYFHEAVGGSRGGRQLLVSSNLDWGQDLPALAKWQKTRGAPDMYVLYYGSVPPQAYGVHVYRWGQLPLPRYAAISITQLYLSEDIPLVRFLREERHPVARAGKSILIYELDAGIADEMTSNR